MANSNVNILNLEEVWDTNAVQKMRYGCYQAVFPAFDRGNEHLPIKVMQTRFK